MTLATSDLVRGAAFYDALAVEIGVSRMGQTETFIAWGLPDCAAGIGLT